MLPGIGQSVHWKNRQMGTTIRPEEIRRGDVFMYSFPVYGDERYRHLIQWPHRVVVLQHNAITGNPAHPHVVVCPISTYRDKHKNPDGTPRRSFQAVLDPSDCVGDEPLDHASIVHLQEMYTLSKHDLRERLFQVQPEAMRRIDAALVVELDLANQLAAETLNLLHAEFDRLRDQMQDGIKSQTDQLIQALNQFLQS